MRRVQLTRLGAVGVPFRISRGYNEINIGRRARGDAAGAERSPKTSGARPIAVASPCFTSLKSSVVLPLPPESAVLRS